MCMLQRKQQHTILIAVSQLLHQDVALSTSGLHHRDCS